MLVRIEPPKGRLLARVDAPALFALLDELRRSLPYEKELEASQAEQRSVTSADPIIPHGLSRDEVAALAGTLETESDLVLPSCAA